MVSGRPVWANFRLLGDCLHITQATFKKSGCIFDGKLIDRRMTKMGWATFWAIFFRLIWSPWLGCLEMKVRPSLSSGQGDDKRRTVQERGVKLGKVTGRGRAVRLHEFMKKLPKMLPNPFFGQN
jgi:hypothetical protein